MKVSHFILAALTILLVACQQYEERPSVPDMTRDSDFHAIMESFVATKTALSNGHSVVWSKGDMLSIFQGFTIADRYQVTDASEGSTNGTFSIVRDHIGELDGDFSGGTEMSFETNVAVYPYEEGLICNPLFDDDDKVLSYTIKNITLPEVQYYVENSFPEETFPMVAVTEGTQDHSLKFRNVGGIMKLQLYGDCAVKSIEVSGNDNEPLAGIADVTVDCVNHLPSLEVTGDISYVVTLDCGQNGVQLNTNEPTQFLISLPPTQFTKGFTVKITDVEGEEYPLTTSVENSVKRSSILKMPATTVGDVSFAPFSVSLSEVGSYYADIEITTSEDVEIAYVVEDEELAIINPAFYYYAGTVCDASDGDIIRISKGVTENTQYYLYVVAKFDDQTYSDIYYLPFTTSSFDFDELVTILDKRLDGYRVHLTIPEYVRDNGNAIRWNQCCLMMYNYNNRYNDSFLLRVNGLVSTTEDTVIEYSEETNRYQTDTDNDGVLDYDYKFNPISPGEPVVFIAGEFSWMEDSSDGDEYFQFPHDWGPGYYYPLLNTAFFTDIRDNSPIFENGIISRAEDSYWTGAFQRKFFRVQEPALLDGGVTVECVEATPVNLKLDFYPDENVAQYVVGVFDDSGYEELLKLLNGKEDFLQWAITSHFAAYTFGTRVAEGDVRMQLNSFYYQDAIAENSNYHVLVTAMGDNNGSSQSFQKFTFQTTERVKDAPEIVVTKDVAKTTPYKAAFNIKCTTAAEGNPVTECYYAANYLRDWLLSINSGSTYFGIIAGNKQYSYFTEDELEKINSAEGLDISIPSLDGETTRLAVLGYNDEYTPNDLTSFKYIEDCPAVADCTTPYTDPKPYVNPALYTDLAGVWTATATLENAEGTKTFEHQSKITLAADLYDYPETLSNYVYELYEKKSDFDKEEVDAMWYEFKQLAKEITEERLENQNRLVGIGWLDKDSYNRLDARTPYDLLIATDYQSVDVSSFFNDFGPKWYLEISKDANGNVVYSIPIDSNFLPPASNWSVPFYLGAMEPDNYVTFLYGEGWTPAFPVTVSEDRNTITISPIKYDGVDYYPNMIGVDNTMRQTLLENPVVSEVVLTRGWEESNTIEQSSVRTQIPSIHAKGELPEIIYKQRTKIDMSPKEMQIIEGDIVSLEQFRQNADRLMRNMYGNQL